MDRKIFCNILFVALLGGYFPLFASEPISIESDEMVYCGREIALSGHVVIESEAGSVMASEARIHRKGEKMQEIELHRGVVVYLREGKRLHCEHAFFNSDTVQGRFSSEPLQERVRYFEEKEGQPLRIECDRLDVDGVRSFCYQPAGVEQVRAIGRVKITHGTEFRAEAERVTYLLTLHKSSSMRPLEIAESSSWRPRVQRSEVVSLLRDPRLSALCDQIERSSQDPLLAFSAEQPSEIIVLSNEVHFQQEGFGFLHSDESLVILRTFHEGEQRMDQVVSLGTTQFDFANPSDGSMCTLTCCGEVRVDQKEHRIDLISADPKRQVHYADDRGHVYANEMKIHYLSSEHGVRGSKIELAGNVRLRSGGLFADSPMPLQLAVADRMEYDPERELMTLEAAPGRYVLFLDESQDTRVSARKVCYDRRENAIEGFGDVRFSLSDPEIGKLKERFKAP